MSENNKFVNTTNENLNMQEPIPVFNFKYKMFL